MEWNGKLIEEITEAKAFERVDIINKHLTRLIQK